MLKAARSRCVLLALTVLFVVSGSALGKAASPPVSADPSFHAAIAGKDVVVKGSGKLRIVELPEDGLLWGPGGDMNPPEPNPGAPSTPRAALLGASVEPGRGCQAVPQVKGVEGFSALCPLQPGGGVRVMLGGADDRLRVDGGTHERYYNDVYEWLGVPLEVEAGDGDDRIDTQTMEEVRVDGGPGNDRLSLGLSGPNNTLIGGEGNDTFVYRVFVATEVYEYDFTPDARTRRVDLDCGPGADYVSPHWRFRHGPGCPARAPRLKGKPVSGVRASYSDERCRWRGPRRLVVTFKNPTSHTVVLRSARLAIERDDSEMYDRRFLTLARRKRLRFPPRGSVRIVIPARRRRALNRQFKEYFFWGVPPFFVLTGALVERDGDHTRVTTYARLRRAHISGVHWIY